MPISTGMDLADVRRTSEHLHAEAERVQGIKQTTDRILHALMSSWRGKDALQFQHDWSGRYRPQLDALIRDLNEMAAVLRRNADEQERVSQSGAPVGSAVPADASATESGVDIGGLVDLAAAIQGMRQAFASDGEATAETLGDVAHSLGNYGTSAKLSTLAESLGGRARGFGSSASALGILGGLLDLQKDPSDPSAYLDLAGSASGLMDNLSSANKMFGHAATALGIGTDLVHMGRAAAAGDSANATFSGIHAAASAIGSVTPTGRLVMGAWDLGTAIGKPLGEMYLASDQGQADQQATWQVGVSQVGGDPDTDPVAAARMVERYSGVGGFVNFMGDSAGASWQRAVALFGGK